MLSMLVNALAPDSDSGENLLWKESLIWQEYEFWMPAKVTNGIPISLQLTSGWV